MYLWHYTHSFTKQINKSDLKKSIRGLSETTLSSVVTCDRPSLNLWLK